MTQLLANTLMGAGGNSFPPFDTTTFPSQLFWLAIVFGALYLVIGRVVAPRIEGILSHRATKIAADLEIAEKAKNEAEGASAAFAKELNDARASAAKLASDTREKSNAEIEGVKVKLETELAAKIAASEAKIQETKVKALASVKNIAEEVTSDIVKAITGKAVTIDAIKAAMSNVKH
jgi:F-type H+-transporting ATPase subunit b